MEKKVVVGLGQMKTKDRWGRKQTIIKIKQTQTNKKTPKEHLMQHKNLKLVEF